MTLRFGQEPSAPEAWASTAPPELLERLGPKEVARQNVIFEIVTGEQAYKKDLDMLELVSGSNSRRHTLDGY